MEFKRKWLQYVTVLLAMAVSLSGCGSGGSDGESRSRWQSDIRYFEEKLEATHPNLYWDISQAQYHEQIDQLYDASPDMQDYEIILELARIATMMAGYRDDHTSVWFRERQDGSFHHFPIKFKWFSDGVFAVKADSAYAAVLGKKLVRIEDTPIDDVVSALSDYISHCNDMWLKARASKYLRVSELLYVLGIIETRTSAVFCFEDDSGNAFDVEIEAILNIGVPGGITLPDPEPEDVLPLYMQNSEQNYWFTYLADDRVVYVAYNACENMPDQSFEEFTADLSAFVDIHETDKLVLDLRNNMGGNSEIIRPLQDVWAAYPYLDTKDRFYIAIGKYTFSSAMLNAVTLQYMTNGSLIGEPTGGRPPNGVYGDIVTFSLPNSGLMVTCSTQYFNYLGEDDPALSVAPDIQVPIASQDYFSRHDPVMEYILNNPLNE